MGKDRSKLWREPGIRVAPSLLAADFGRIGEQLRQVEAAGAELVHLDVMDGHFVPNISFGVPVIRSLRKQTDLFFDTHLMITDPLFYAKPFVEAGSDNITFHIELEQDPREVVERIRSLGACVGISLNPGTPAEAVFDILPEVDLVLVMSVWPGFGGQQFIRDVLPKIRAIRQRLRPDQRLEVDGGIGVDTAGAVAEAGADVLVAGSAVFASPDPAQAISQIRLAAEQAASCTPSRKNNQD